MDIGIDSRTPYKISNNSIGGGGAGIATLTVFMLVTILSICPKQREQSSLYLEGIDLPTVAFAYTHLKEKGGGRLGKPMICLSFAMKQRGGLVLFNLSQVALSLNLNAAHLILLPTILGNYQICLFLPMPAALFLVIRLFDLTPTTQKGCSFCSIRADMRNGGGRKIAQLVVQ